MTARQCPNLFLPLPVKTTIPTKCLMSLFDVFCVKKCPPPKPSNLIKVHQIICNCLLMILGFGLLYQMRVNVGGERLLFGKKLLPLQFKRLTTDG